MANSKQNFQLRTSFSKQQRNRYWNAYWQRKFAGQVVGVTGRSPLTLKFIKKLIENNGGIVGNKDIWQAEQIIVIGRQGYDEEYLKLSVQFGLERGFQCVYLSQEAFRDLVENDKYPGYFKGDPRIKKHPGLSFLSSIGFKWPSSDAVPGRGVIRNTSGWLEVHPLRAIYGYKVQKGTSFKIRYAALMRAIRQDGLGLRVVAEHIAFLIRFAKSRHDDLMDDAIGTWESDLKWLYKTFYKNSIHRFIWPSV